MLTQEWTNLWAEIYFYLFCRFTEFMRWIELPEEYWIWMDKNMFEGALREDGLLHLAVILNQMNQKFSKIRLSERREVLSTKNQKCTEGNQYWMMFQMTLLLG